MKFIPSLLAAFVGISLLSASPASAQVKKYKFKESGDGWRGRPWMGIVIERNGNRTPRRTEQVSAFSAIAGSWADYPATAIRACKGSVDTFDSTDCITSKGKSIVLPKEEDPLDYSFEFKYKYGSSIREGTFVLPGKFKASFK